MTLFQFPDQRPWRRPTTGFACTFNTAGYATGSESLNDVEGVCAACGHDQCEVLWDSDGRGDDGVFDLDLMADRTIELYRCLNCGLEQGET